MSARLIQVIEVTVQRGGIARGSLGRSVVQYWSTNGDLLAESDPASSLERPAEEQRAAVTA